MNPKTTIKLNRGLSSLFTAVVAVLSLGATAHTVNAANNKTISVSGNLAFGNVQLGSSAQAVITISNASAGSGVLTVSGISLPAGFSTTFTSATLKPGKSTSATIKFSPTAGQNYSGFAVVNSSAAKGTNKLPVSGAGVGQAVILRGNLSFGLVPINTSAHQMLTISNSGSTNLTVTGISYPNGFSGSFSGLIAPKVSTNVTVTFSPTTATKYGGLVTVASDALFGTNTIAASGTGTNAGAAIISLSGNLSFGNVLLNTSARQNLVISNSGNLTLHVNGISFPPGFSGAFSGAIAPGAKATVAVTFAPTAMTNYNGVVTVTSDASSGVNTIAASGIGAASAIALSGNLNFGGVIAGSSEQLSLTISNTGNATLNVSSIHYPIGFSGAFSGAIAAGGAASITVTFSPTNGSPYSGAITVNSDALSGVNSVNASGTGIAQTRVISLSGNLDFGDIYVSNSTSLPLTISNSGNSELTFTDIQLPAGFTVDASAGVLAPGAGTTVTVTFSPTNAAAYNGTLTVNSDATSGTNTVDLTGNGVNVPTRIISLSGDLNFGKVTVNTSAQLTLLLTNSGNADLTFTNIEVPTGFSVNLTSGVLASGTTTNVTVTFSPTDTNNYGGPITIDSDATAGTNIVNASGAGTAAIVPTRIIALSGDLDFGDVAVGSSPQLALTISNAGNSTLTVSNITFPNGFSGSFSGAIASGAATNVTVTFTPVANQPYRGTITVLSDATFGTNTITASGDAFRYVPAKVRMNGLFYPANDVEFTNAGYFKAQATTKGVFSARMKLAGNQCAVSGRFSATGSFSGNVARKNLSTLTVTLQAGFDGGKVWKGTISDGSFLATLHADAATFQSKTNPAPQAGIYHIMIAGCTNAAMAPATNGTGTLTVMTSGAAKIMVTLGDGTKVTQVTAVSQDGQIPFFGSLYGNKGSILGWLAFGNTPGDELNGLVDWFKPAGISANYPTGFSFDTALSGAKQ